MIACSTRAGLSKHASMPLFPEATDTEMLSSIAAMVAASITAEADLPRLRFRTAGVR